MMLTMDKMLDRENDAIMTYCNDLFNEWRINYSPNKAARQARQLQRCNHLQRERFAKLERIAECQRIDNALQNGIDPYEADLRTRMWAIRIGC